MQSFSGGTSLVVVGVIILRPEKPRSDDAPGMVAPSKSWRELIGKINSFMRHFKFGKFRIFRNNFPTQEKGNSRQIFENEFPMKIFPFEEVKDVREKHHPHIVTTSNNALFAINLFAGRKFIIMAIFWSEV